MGMDAEVPSASMSRPLRLEYPGSLWHITVRGNEKRPTFHTDRDRLRFLDLLGEAVRRFRWILTAYVLMSNHYHLLLQLTEETLATGMHWLNGTYAPWFNRSHERVGHLFQGRYKSHLIEKETYFLEVVRYVVLNPVRANMVEWPDAYEWSSYRATAGRCATPPWLAADNVLAHFANDRGVARARYAAFVEAGIDCADSPWNDLVGQMYLGSEAFVKRMRDRVEVKPRVAEHPLAQRDAARPTMAAIVAAVATVLDVPEERIRYGRGGAPRSLAAWIGCYEGLLTNGEIAATLRLRSDRRVTSLVADCDRELRQNEVLRECADRCLATMGRKKCRLQT